MKANERKSSNSFIPNVEEEDESVESNNERKDNF